MKRVFIVIACLAAAVAQAGVYRWVDDNGDIHFGDAPPSQTDAEKVKLPALNRAKPQPVPVDAAQDQPSEDVRAAGNYEVLEIVEPANDGTVRSNEQKVKVAINVVPGLSQGHRIAIYLDGAPVGDGIPGTRAVLQGIVRGTHRLQAKVVDDQGRVVIESETNRFYLRQATVRPLP